MYNFLAVSGGLAFYCGLVVSDGVNFPFSTPRLISRVLVVGAVSHLADNTDYVDVITGNNFTHVVH